ncbi:5'-nucleotidase C-terminal domain-containing protein [Mesotoga sp. H07.pep.5.3]|uniref:5'-nucleotidase C-terminal domain-containing protein n=2 Tax=unclassified Mesotoga TaxID=1184398 RepID=UPI000C19D161|nr:5'-nucleotidase C-terminal domain-containing protein [Mesotoga sp. H07.pep.5.3]PIJ62496.1 5'-nucleotidase [Mesotoga sp. H07.pep.5.3]
MRKLLALILTVSVLTMALASYFRLTILHTSFVPANTAPFDYSSGKSEDVFPARLAAFVNQMRLFNPNTLFIDTGNLIRGTPLSYYSAKIDYCNLNPFVEAMNAIGINASLIGSEEFIYGPGFLEEAISASEFPLLSANIVFKSSGEPVFSPFEVVEIQDDGEKLRVGIVGLVTEVIPPWQEAEFFAGLSFVDPVDAAGDYLGKLREEVDVLVLAYRGSNEEARKIVKALREIDVFLKGPQLTTKSAIVDGVVISGPGYIDESVSKIDIYLEKTGEGWKIHDRSVDEFSMSGFLPDESVVEIFRGYNDQIQKLLDTRVGFAVGDFYVEDAFKVRLRDNPLAEFINRVQMEVTGAEISCTSVFDYATTGWKTGPITIGEIYEVYPLPSTLKVLELTGGDIKEALEFSAERFVTDDGLLTLDDWSVDDYSNYDMWEGIEYIIAVDRPVGERVLSVRHNGKPLDMAETYEVSMSSFRAGGGGYSMFENKPVVRDVKLQIFEIITDFVQERFAISPQVDNNWSVGTGFIHTVGWNETLRSISQMYGIEDSEIMKYNPDLVGVKSIPAGSELIVYRPFLQDK